MDALYSMAETALANQSTPQEAYKLIIEDSRSMLQAWYCAQAGGAENICAGICPSPDLAGSGMRFAFYAQITFNTITVFRFPEDDSAGGQWVLVFVSLCLVIPAMVQKYKGNLTLFHATLVLNFATLSTLASFAVAPWCAVWRERGNREPRLQGSRPGQRLTGRAVMRLALIFQMIVYCGWLLLMFTTPPTQYAQSICDVETVLFFFWYQLRASQIDGVIDSQSDGDLPPIPYLWWLWLVFHVGAILAFFGIFIISQEWTIPPSRLSSPVQSTPSFPPRTRLLSRLGHALRLPFSPNNDQHPETQLFGKLWSAVHGIVALSIFGCLIAVTELQHARNALILPGEDDVSGWGQLAAIIAVLVYGWSFRRVWSRSDSKDTKPSVEAKENVVGPSGLSSAILMVAPSTPPNAARQRWLRRKPSADQPDIDSSVPPVTEDNPWA